MSCDAVSLSWKQKLLAATTEIEDDLDLPLPFHIFLFYLFTKKKITQRFHDVNKKKSQTKTIKIFIFSCLVAHIIIIFFALFLLFCRSVAQDPVEKETK